MKLILTVSHDRDESCNDYTLTHRFEVDVCDADIIKAATRDLLAMWKQSYPHRGRTPHAPVVDVTLDSGPDTFEALVRLKLSEGQTTIDVQREVEAIHARVREATAAKLYGVPAG